VLHYLHTQLRTMQTIKTLQFWVFQVVATVTQLPVSAALTNQTGAMHLLMTGQLHHFHKYNTHTHIIHMKMLLRSKGVLKQQNKLLCRRRQRTEQLEQSLLSQLLLWKTDRLPLLTIRSLDN